MSLSHSCLYSGRLLHWRRRDSGRERRTRDWDGALGAAGYVDEPQASVPCRLRPWWHGREGLDRGNLWHWWNQRYRLTWWKRGDGWHRWDRRSHTLSAGHAPHLIEAAYGHRDDEEWHEPEHDDHPHGSASHRVCPPCRREASIGTLASPEYTDGAGARQHHRCSRLESRLQPRTVITHASLARHRADCAADGRPSSPYTARPAPYP